MLSQAPERVVAIIRWLLVLGWVGILVLCFSDVHWSALTAPGQGGLWEATTVTTASGEIPGRAYNPGPRLFWGLAIPLTVLLLIFAGHETWRRICPMSAIAQLPRKLGLQRRVGSGPNRQVPTVAAGSFWARHALLIQFSLFTIGVCARLTVLAAHPLALALTTAGVFALALLVGFLWGGKTWCHYVCPMHVVQLVINGPRGLGGSHAAVASNGVSQSMCRSPGTAGDRSACVACNAPCPDIDLERHYWDGLGRGERRLVVYGYLGVVLGFMAVLQLAGPGYGGAIWYHTDWSAPGWRWGEAVIAWPRYLTTPLTMLAAVLLTMTLGRIAEAIYGRLLARGRDAAVARDLAQHRLLTLTTVVALFLLVTRIALPGLAWLGPIACNALAVVTVIALSIWGYRTWQRSNIAYQQESMAGSLRRRLAQLPIDLSTHLNGRRIEELSPGEVQILADLVPGLERNNRLSFYEQVLADAIASGATNDTEGRRLLTRMRERFQVSDVEHRAILARLQGDVSDDSMLGTTMLRRNGYRQQLEHLLLGSIARGMSLADAVEAEAQAIRRMREEFGISDEDEQRVLATLGAGHGLLRQAGDALTEQLGQIRALNGGLDPRQQSEAFLVRYLDLSAVAIARQCFGLIEVLAEDDEAARELLGQMRQAHAMAMHQAYADGESGWSQRLPPDLVAQIGNVEATVAMGAIDAVPAEQSLPMLAADDDEIVAMVACRAAIERGLPGAMDLVHALLRRGANPLVRLALGHLTEGTSSKTCLQVTLADGSSHRCHDQAVIGRSRGVDIHVDEQRYSRRHCRIWVDSEGAWIEDLGGLNGTLVDHHELHESRMRLPERCRIRAGHDDAGIQVEVLQVPVANAADPLSLFLILSAVPLFTALEPKDLLQLAVDAQSCEAVAGETLVPIDEPLEEMMVLLSGRAAAMVGERRVGSIGPGDPIGGLALLTDDRSNAAVVAETDCQLVVWPSRSFGAIINGRHGVAAGLLRLVSRRLVGTLRSMGTTAESPEDRTCV